MPFKTATNNGITITFDPEDHSYKDNQGQTYISVTTFIDQFFPKFDPDSMATKCAEGSNPKYKGRDPEDIKAEWKAKGDQARENGDDLHAWCEWFMPPWRYRGPSLPEPKMRTTRSLNLAAQAQIAINRLADTFHFVATEKIVFSPRLGIAGQLDLLMHDSENEPYDMIILDWKQNEEITKDNPWETALPPIEHLDACDLAKYELQLNLYEKIMREEYHFDNKGYRKALIHILEDGKRIIKVGDRQKEINNMIEYMDV